MQCVFFFWNCECDEIRNVKCESWMWSWVYVPTDLYLGKCRGWWRLGSYPSLDLFINSQQFSARAPQDPHTYTYSVQSCCPWSAMSRPNALREPKDNPGADFLRRSLMERKAHGERLRVEPSLHKLPEPQGHFLNSRTTSRSPNHLMSHASPRTSHQQLLIEYLWPSNPISIYVIYPCELRDMGFYFYFFICISNLGREKEKASSESNQMGLPLLFSFWYSYSAPNIGHNVDISVSHGIGLERYSHVYHILFSFCHDMLVTISYEKIDP